MAVLSMGSGLTAPTPKTQGTYQTPMQQYTQYQTQAGYSPEQIAAMTSPWVQADQNKQSDAAWAAAHPGAGSVAQFQHAADPNTVANGIQYAAYVPGWNTSMSMADKYQQEVDANSSGFNQMRDEALSKGPSAWASTERLKQAQLAAEERDKGNTSAAASTAAAADSLAASGGMSSGARERIAEGGAKNLVGMNQGIATAALNNDLNIGSTDETNKMSMLSNVAGQEAQRSSAWMQAHQGDIAQNTAETERLNAYNQHLADQKNQAYAAQQQANATRSSGK